MRAFAPAAGEGRMIYAFGDYELDTRRLELRRGAEVCRVEPQVFDVLVVLVRNRDRLVMRREILEEVWGHAFVTESTLSSRLKEARRAVGDSGSAQEVIRTVHGRGYRFVAEVEVRSATAAGPAGDGAAGPSQDGAGETPAVGATGPPAPRLVGREYRLREMERLFHEARAGARRVVFVSGEAGIGKTALVEAFLAWSRAAGARLARGQCLDQRGAGEPYLPVLEAVGRMCREADGGALVALLGREAPTWLAQMPGLVAPEEAAALLERTLGATRERMLREAVAALEAWAAERPLVFVLEDLHWSDPSTLQLVDCLARRRDPARLLLVGTYRPAEVRLGGHPLQTLVQELRVRDLCAELALPPLSEEAVREYLASRFPGSALPAELHRLLHARTEGNPLFVRSVVDAWVAAGALARAGDRWELRAEPSRLQAAVPETLERMIQQQVERLSPEARAALEAASVAGAEFSAAAAAAGLGLPMGEVEAECELLARQGRFLRARDVEEWPDGTVSGRYSFVHHLHRDVVYRRLSGGRRTALHRSIGRRLEAAHGTSAAARAPELALHFTEGRDGERAVEYHCRAAEQALARSAHREAVDHLTRALGLLREHSDIPGAAHREIGILRMLGPALVALRGWNDPEAELAFRRARELCEETGDRRQLARVLYGLAYVHEIRGEYPRSQSLVEERFRLEVPEGEPGHLIESYELLSCSLFHQGAFAGALEKARSGIGLFLPGAPGAPPADRGEHAGVACHYWAGLALWFLGRPEGAAASLEEAVRLAADAQHLYMLAMAKAHVAQLYQLRREARRVAGPALEALSLADRQGYPYQLATARAMYGWARVMAGDVDGGLEHIREGVRTEEEIGAAMERPYFLGVLADALEEAGRVDEGLAVVGEALERVRENGRSFFWEAELHRVRGVLLSKRGGHAAEAEECFAQALGVARRQGALALELRAVLALCRPPVRVGRRSEARRTLSDLYRRFTEGFDAPDLRAARECLRAAEPV